MGSDGGGLSDDEEVDDEEVDDEEVDDEQVVEGGKIKRSETKVLDWSVNEVQSCGSGDGE